MSSFKEHHPNCDECESVCDYVYIPTVPHVSFLDGPSGSWPSKGERFKKYRQKQHEIVGRKQMERYGSYSGKDAVPNFNGVETETWKEAQEMAKKENGAQSAATYDVKVAQEKSKP